MLDTFKKKVAQAFFKTEQVEKTHGQQLIMNPLEMKVGSVFEIKTNNDRIYKSLFKKQSEYNVVAIGVAKLTEFVTAYRFYDSVKNSAIAGVADSFLQILVSSRGNEQTVLERRMFQLKAEDFPKSTLAWNNWVGMEGSIIGKFDASFEDRAFERLEGWSSTDGEWSPAKHYVEQVVEKVDASVITVVTHDAMLYGRWLNEQNQVAEYILYTSDSVKINTKSNVYLTASFDVIEAVGTYVGIDVTENDIVVKF